MEEISQCIYSETTISKRSIAMGEHNHAVLLRNIRFAIKQGVEQRYAAINMGAKGDTTLVYKNEDSLFQALIIMP